MFLMSIDFWIITYKMFPLTFNTVKEKIMCTTTLERQREQSVVLITGF